MVGRVGIQLRRVPGLDPAKWLGQPKGLMGRGQLEMQLKYEGEKSAIKNILKENFVSLFPDAYL